jgi:long-chain acyl-CoA synthetase
MIRRTLLDFFEDVTGAADQGHSSATDRADRSDQATQPRTDQQTVPAAKYADARAEFLAYDDGYRTWSWTYGELGRQAREFAARLRASGVIDGQAIAIWSENRPEWIAALWGALLEGVVVVPIDYRASGELLGRVAGIVGAKAILVGDVVDGESLGSDRPVWRLQDVFRREVRQKPDMTSNPGARPSTLGPDTTAEIIFTSGATAEPKGVVLTHRNILANIIPIEREMAKYRKYTLPFRPIRFLNLLPLSHMFGQAMATFVPPLLPGVVLFTRSYAPEDIVRHIRERRISVLVCVPKMLEVLREYVLKQIPEAAEPPPAGMHWARRWWRYRRVHRMFGWKFWSMVVGAAPLDPELEAFWGRLGFVVVQGYGLTETAPIVTLNHPLRAARGAVGKPIGGVDVKIAEDGEILVRGENVTRGYFNAPEETRSAFEDGWFHTGDIGDFDAEGQLHIRGRKKEMIVTPEGLNVFPEDVERALNEQPGVRESAVVGAPVAGSTAERVQAVLVLTPGVNLDEVVRAANRTLADHQKVRAAVVWPGPELPRTDGTRKLKRRELRQWLAGQQTHTPPASGGRDVVSVLARFAPGRTIEPSTTIDELGLSSLERVELMMALEEAFQITVDEAAFSAATTVSDLAAVVRPLSGLETRPEGLTMPAERSRHPGQEAIAFPAWNRSLPVRAIRRASLPTWILPLGRLFARVTVEGLDNLRTIDGPVIFAANHQSHLDTPVILDSLPPALRYRVAPAMAKEFFKAHFYPEQFGRRAWFTNSLNYYLAAFFFNAFPLPQREAGTRQTLRYIGDLIEDGYSILIFPEGRRTESGEVARFQPGIGMIAARLDVPVVPVRLDGLDRILHHTSHFPTRGRARCAFGAPISLHGNDYPAVAAQVESAVRAL